MANKKDKTSYILGLKRPKAHVDYLNLLPTGEGLSQLSVTSFAKSTKILRKEKKESSIFQHAN